MRLLAVASITTGIAGRWALGLSLDAMSLAGAQPRQGRVGPAVQAAPIQGSRLTQQNMRRSSNA